MKGKIIRKSSGKIDIETCIYSEKHIVILHFFDNGDCGPVGPVFFMYVIIYIYLHVFVWN